MVRQCAVICRICRGMSFVVVYILAIENFGWAWLPMVLFFASDCMVWYIEKYAVEFKPPLVEPMHIIARLQQDETTVIYELWNGNNQTVSKFSKHRFAIQALENAQLELRNSDEEDGKCKLRS